MRILQVYHIYPALFGGASTVVYQLTKELSRRGHEVSVLTTNAYLDCGKKCEGKNGIIYRFELFSKILPKQNIMVTNPEFVLWAKKMARNFDCIHLHGYRNVQNIVIHHYAKKYGVPYVLQAHGTLPRIMAKQRLKRIFDVFFGYRILKDASKVIALSQTEAEQYMRMGISKDKIAIIPNGIDLSEYGDLPPRGCFREKFGIDEDEKMVLYLGRIHRIKGIDILVKAFASIVGKLDDVRLVVVGPDDGFLGELEALIKALKMEDNVLILRALYGEDKLKAFVDADVYVLPSRYETFPMSVLEAVSCGTPVILTENCGIREHFRDKVGLVVKPNLDHLGEALLEMLLDQGRQNTFRENCNSVMERFDISNTVSRLEEVYEELVMHACSDQNHNQNQNKF